MQEGSHFILCCFNVGYISVSVCLTYLPSLVKRGSTMLHQKEIQLFANLHCLSPDAGEPTDSLHAE